MKKIVTTLGLLLLLIGCSPTSSQDTEENQPEDTAQQSNEQSNENESAENSGEENDSDEQDKEQDRTETPGDEPKESNEITELRPSEGIVKVFKQTGGYSFKEKIIAMNERYVQRLLILGDMKTLQVLEWDTEEIKKVYELSNPQEENENILDSFKPIDNTEILLSESNVGDGIETEWQIIEKNVELTTPFDTFTNVIVTRKSFTEGNEDTIHTIYYAPGYGMVKEVYEVTGENGYEVVTELEKIEEI